MKQKGYNFKKIISTEEKEKIWIAKKQMALLRFIIKKKMNFR